ncbi:hypothetical protein AKJ09_07717 [Labilithrix luteola]|uniref:Uncharacterized protein n=1 Tax=Labilithrix luteola TaxID=1391654 RepID=A0A0K1Q5P8_9BACT|nr:hypothetical protein AKJ09_07717 [Labilithrix luteola]
MYVRVREKRFLSGFRTSVSAATCLRNARSTLNVGVEEATMLGSLAS